MRVTVIGKHSFMATALRESGIGQEWQWLSHKEALQNTDWLKTTDLLINFAYAPALRNEAYTAEADIDIQLAQLIGGYPIHYIMLSSRMVYGHPQGSPRLHETMKPQPLNIYGQNKQVIEGLLAGCLPPERLTILRLSNIFGFEPRRRSFFGMALTRLAEEGRIVYDMNPFIQRDFLSVERFGKALEIIAAAPKSGIFNLGAGFAVETGLIAEWLIEGYGSGELLINNMERRDAFWLDMGKTYATFAIPSITPDHVKEDCVRCGRAMREWHAKKVAAHG